MLKYALIPLLPFAGFLVAGLFGKYLKERSAYFPIAGVIGAFLLSVNALFDVVGGAITQREPLLLDLHRDSSR